MSVSKLLLQLSATLLLSAASMSVCMADTVDELLLINISQLITPINGNPITVRIDDVSFDGNVVIGRFTDFSKTSGRKVFRYTKHSGMEEIADLVGISIDTLRVSADGAVIWGAKYDLSKGTTSGIFRWTRARGLQEFGDLGRRSMSIAAASDSGEFVAGSFLTSPAPIYHAFRYSEAIGFEDLGAMHGDSAFAQGVSSDGQLILGHVQFQDKRASRAFLYSKIEGSLDVGTYAGNWTSATGVSRDRSVIVGNYCSGGFYYLTACTRSPFVYTKKIGIQASPKIPGSSIVGPKVSPDGKMLSGSYIDSKYESYIFTARINLD